MKKFVGVIITVVTLALCLTLSACTMKYVSNYSASTEKSSNTMTNASVSFGSFKGTYVIKLRNNGGDEVRISYEATLGEGNIKVYYDYNDEKLDLFEIGNNGSVKAKTETFTGSKLIYIVIESDGNCNKCSFSFSLEKSGN